MYLGFFQGEGGGHQQLIFEHQQLQTSDMYAVFALNNIRFFYLVKKMYLLKSTTKSWTE